MDLVGEIDFFASLLSVVLLTLLDGSEARLFIVTELAEDIGLLNRRVPPSAFFKRLVGSFNFLAVRLSTAVSEIPLSGNTWHMLAHWVIWVSPANCREVIGVAHDSTLLHDSEGALGTGLLNVPNHLVVDSVLNCLVGILSFLGVEFSITVLVEEFGKDEVPIADHAITVQVITYVRHEGPSARLLHVRHIPIRVSLRSLLPPLGNFHIFSALDHALGGVFEGHLMVHAFVVNTERLVHAAVEGLMEVLVRRLGHQACFGAGEGLISLGRLGLVCNGFAHLLVRFYLIFKK